jgi:hypothetical protein
MRLHRPLKRWGILDGNVDASVVRGDTVGTLRHGQQDLSREECEVSNKRVGCAGYGTGRKARPAPSPSPREPSKDAVTVHCLCFRIS